MATPITIQSQEPTLGEKLARAWAYLGYGLQMIPPMVLPIFPNRSASKKTVIGDRTISYYRHWPSCPKLLADWDALSLKVPGATAFQSPAWQHAIARLGDSLGTLRLITVHQNEQLIAVVPLERHGRSHWHTPGCMTTDYLDPLVMPDNSAMTWRAILQSIREFSRDTVETISFDLVAPESPLREQLAALPASTGFVAKEEPASAATNIPLPPTWEQYLGRLGSHDRKELRRKIKKAEEKGGGQLVVSDTTLSVEHALRDVFALMEASGGGKGRKAKWLFRPHFRVAAPALAKSGRLIVYQLFLHHKLAASLIALPSSTHQILWCGAIDQELGQWSPGIVLFGMVFRHAISLGHSRIDLLRGQYPYKYSLGAEDRTLTRITLVDQKKS
ncbi:GNAT family N-acetyltransferase [soil metagenome]